MMIGEAEVLRRLVEECLDYDPAVRPTIATVCERIQVSKNVYMKDCPKECITVLQQVQQLKAEIFLLRNETEQQRTTIEQMVMRLIVIITLYGTCFVSPPQGVHQHNK